MHLPIGTILKTSLGESITLTGNRSIRGKYCYLFKDEHGSRGFIYRHNLLKQLTLGEVNIITTTNTIKS